MRARTHRYGRQIPTAIVVALALALPASSALAQDEEPPSVETGAVFEGQLIDIADDWGDATACMVWPAVLERPECFRTEAEMDTRIAQLEKDTGLTSEAALSIGAFGIGGVATAGTNCSGYLRLYDGTFYTGAVLYVRGRYQWIDLASVNFNNKTSSFKIGPCSAYFADLAGGGGAWYPTSATQAYDVAATMVSGWNNDVSSLYIT